MIPYIKITKDISIQKHLKDGMKIFFKFKDRGKDNYRCKKLNNKDLNNLILGINCIRD